MNESAEPVELDLGNEAPNVHNGSKPWAASNKGKRPYNGDANGNGMLIADRSIQYRNAM